MPDDALYSPDATAAALPYAALAGEVEALLRDRDVVVPSRLVEPMAGGGSLFVMPAHDARVAITKLITFVPTNTQRDLPSIQGDIVVFDVETGSRIAILDGPTVTARRTAAVSLLAARKLAPLPNGPLLIVGAGVQGRAHLEAFREGLGVAEVWIASRRRSGSDALAAHAETLGMRARVVDDPNQALAHCPLVVTATPAQQIVMTAAPRPDAFVAAVGAFTPKMVEWAPDICRQIAVGGSMAVDTRDADHEAGDLIQAGIDVSKIPALADLVRKESGQAGREALRASGPVFFKSCGWAGWDLAAARCLRARLRMA